MENNALLENLEKLHTTELGAGRIIRNLQLGSIDAVKRCKELILGSDAIFKRIGKNWYVLSGNCKITVNAYSYTIITAHKIKL